jgi:hypothetical protein
MLPRPWNVIDHVFLKLRYQIPAVALHKFVVLVFLLHTLGHMYTDNV